MQRCIGRCGGTVILLLFLKSANVSAHEGSAVLQHGESRRSLIRREHHREHRDHKENRRHQEHPEEHQHTERHPDQTQHHARVNLHKPGHHTQKHASAAANGHTAELASARSWRNSGLASILSAVFATQDLKPGMMTAILLLAATLVLLLLAIAKPEALLGSAFQDLSAARRRVEQLRLTSGAEIQSMYGLKAGESKPVSPGLLMRLRGKVVTKAAKQPPLSSPMSARQCVLYSASVSQQNDNGVHSPPLAFHAARMDFAIELTDPDGAVVRLEVNGQDASLFDMVGGRTGGESTFAKASDSWRSFIISHPAPGHAALADAKEGVSSLSGQMEFRECALLTNSIVTVVGEITRERDGVLWLNPWRAPAAHGGLADKTKCLSAMLPWRRSGASLSVADPAVGKVLITDDPALVADYWATPRIV